jgi:LacI family transcriptional regulator, galactose operon repressor
MKDIAADLGLSPMAVSKALRDHSDISARTKQRVLKRASELKYRINHAARSLVTGRTYLIGLIVPDLMQSYFAEIANAVEARLRTSGYHLVIAHTDEQADQEVEHLRQLTERNVDGLLIASAQRETRHIRNLKVPYVLIDRSLEGLRANFVGCADEEIGYLATEHLIQQGSRHIAHLKGPELSMSEDRLRGYHRALSRYGLTRRDNLVVPAGHDDASGYHAMKALLAHSTPPDGVFCFNDPIAVGALRAIAEAGLSIPQDVAVIGSANMHYSEMLAVPLSTVDQGTAQIGLNAASRLLARLTAEKESPVEHTLVAPRLIVRASSLRQR